MSETRPPGSFLIPLLKAQLAMVGGHGEVDFDRGEARSLEAVIGPPGSAAFLPVTWLRGGVDQASGVARVGPSLMTGHGTGFLLDGAVIDPHWAGRPLLMTNAHVVCPSADHHIYESRTEPLDPAQTSITFHTHDLVDGAPVEYRAKDGKCLWVNHEVDCSLIELDRPPARRPATITVSAAAPVAGQQVYAVGYPNGGELTLSFSIKDNKVVKVHDPWVSYRTSTTPGSSGSPIFNQQWQLLALHSGSEGVPVRANVGALVQSVLQRCRPQLV